MKRKILLLILALALLLCACGDPETPATTPVNDGTVAGTQPGIDTQPTEPEAWTRIEFIMDGAAAWLSRDAEDAVSLGYVYEEAILSEAEKKSYGITAEEEVRLQMLYRYTGTTTIAEDRCELEIDTAWMAMRLLCNDPETAVQQMLASLSNETDVYEKLFAGWVDLTEIDPGRVPYGVGRRMVFEISGSVLTGVQLYEEGVLSNEGEFYENGSMKLLTNYENGQIISVSEYYENGNDKKFTRYTDGAVSSVSEYDEQGNQLNRTVYNKDGTVADGTYRVYEYYAGGTKKEYWEYDLNDNLKNYWAFDESGSTRVQKEYHDNGQLRYHHEKNEYGDEVLSVWYDEAGQLEHQTRYERTYYESGVRKTVAKYENELLMQYDEYYENRMPKRSVSYREDGVIGGSVEFYENGNQKQWCQYYEGTGTLREQSDYDENGVLRLELLYRYNGNLQRRTEYDENGQVTLQIFYDEEGKEFGRNEY